MDLSDWPLCICVCVHEGEQNNCPPTAEWTRAPPGCRRGALHAELFAFFRALMSINRFYKVDAIRQELEAWCAIIAVNAAVAVRVVSRLREYGWRDATYTDEDCHDFYDAIFIASSQKCFKMNLLGSEIIWKLCHCGYFPETQNETSLGAVLRAGRVCIFMLCPLKACRPLNLNSFCRED